MTTSSPQSEQILTNNEDNYHNKHNRHLIGGYQPNQAKGPAKPQLRLAGKWLAECGFTTGKTVQVTTMPGKIVITLPDRYPEKESAHQTPISWKSSSIGVLRFGKRRCYPKLKLT